MSTPYGWVLITGHGNAFHLGAEPPKCEVPEAWKPVYASSQPTDWVTLGVGTGDTGLFVHGPHDAIKRCQDLILERDHLKAASTNYKPSGDQTIDRFLAATDPEFDQVVRALPITYWARYDLSAVRVGWILKEQAYGNAQGTKDIS